METRVGIAESSRDGERIRRRRVSIGAALVMFLLVVGAWARGDAANGIKHAVKWAIVQDRHEWLLPLATPVIAKLEAGGEIPLLFLVSPTAKSELEWLKNMRPCDGVVIESEKDDEFRQLIANYPMTLIGARSDPFQASVELARRFWGKPQEIAVAFLDDAGAVILASSMAAHLRQPLIVLSDGKDLGRLRDAIGLLGVRRAWLVQTTEAPETAGEIASIAQITTVDAAGVQSRVIEHFGRDRVRNIVLVRVPEAKDAKVSAAWLAPYLSAVRHSPVVLTTSENPELAEKAVNDLIQTHGLRPHTLTILADYTAIGVFLLKDRDNLGEYELEIEPCSDASDGAAIPLGVGRIPLALADATGLITRGLMKERGLFDKPFRLLMIANAKTDFTALPFCETACRVTVQDFENVGVPVDEFYGLPSNAPAIVAAAGEAGLIMYQGHVCDQLLFLSDQQPMLIFQSEGEGIAIASEQGLMNDASTPRSVDPSTLPSDDRQYVPMNDPTSGVLGETPAPAPAQQPARPAAPELRLNGLPVVVLQSCRSLDEPISKVIFHAGGTGVIGSVTSIHSASGSAFMHNMSGGMLYRQETIGEALRDARNYFLCLARLKHSRGHKEQAKAYRVAMSFRLWGDPELRVVSHTLKQPVRRPVAASLAAGDKVQVRFPARHLPEVRTARYLARLFPGSQMAGIVTKLKGREERRVLPLYFFRFPLPAGFPDKGYSRLASAGETKPAAAFLIDAFDRYLYVVYFPKKAEKDEKTLLQFDQ